METLRIEDNCPCYTDSKKNKVFGTFIDRPSEDGMTQAEFTDSAGFKQIVELPFLTYREYKGDSAVYCKPPKKRRRRSEGKAISKKGQRSRRRLKRGKAISKKAGKVTKKPAAHQKGPTGLNLEEAGTKPFRPDQYYLLKRPADMPVDTARNNWRAMSPNEKKQFGIDTWEERKARKR